MTKREIRELREKIGTDPILTDEEIEHIWTVMDKAEPMKVKTTFGGWLNCPACDMDISDYGTHDFTPGYCPNCGQAIDWEEATK